MPPKGKTPLTDDEAAVLAWWIEAGLPNHDTLRALQGPGGDPRRVLAHPPGRGTAGG